MNERFAQVIKIIGTEIEECQELVDKNSINRTAVFDPFANACEVENARRTRLEDLKKKLFRAPEETPDKVEIPSFVAVQFDDEEGSEVYLITDSETKVDVNGLRIEVISNESAFGMSILGRKSGEEFSYEVGKGGARSPLKVTGKVVHIK